MRRRQEQVGRKFAEAREARELGNVGLRLEHMDASGVDVQVLHNTMFIEEVTERAPVEVALCGSWNRWLADIWSQSDGRLALVVSCAYPEHVGRAGPDPLLQGARRLRGADAARRGQPRAGGSVFLSHLRGGQPPGHGHCRAHRQRQRLAQRPLPPSGQAGSLFHRFRIPTVGGFAHVLFSEVPELFPKLRWGFIEASAQWLPWILHEARNRFRTRGREWPDNPMEAFRMS